MWPVDEENVIGVRGGDSEEARQERVIWKEGGMGRKGDRQWYGWEE